MVIRSYSFTLSNGDTLHFVGNQDNYLVTYTYNGDAGASYSHAYQYSAKLRFVGGTLISFEDWDNAPMIFTHANDMHGAWGGESYGGDAEQVFRAID